MPGEAAGAAGTMPKRRRMQPDIYAQVSGGSEKMIEDAQHGASTKKTGGKKSLKEIWKTHTLNLLCQETQKLAASSQNPAEMLPSWRPNTEHSFWDNPIRTQ